MNLADIIEKELEQRFVEECNQHSYQKLNDELQSYVIKKYISTKLPQVIPAVLPQVERDFWADLEALTLNKQEMWALRKETSLNSPFFALYSPEKFTPQDLVTNALNFAEKNKIPIYKTAFEKVSRSGIRFVDQMSCEQVSNSFAQIYPHFENAFREISATVKNLRNVQADLEFDYKDLNQKFAFSDQPLDPQYKVLLDNFFDLSAKIRVNEYLIDFFLLLLWKVLKEQKTQASFNGFETENLLYAVSQFQNTHKRVRSKILDPIEKKLTEMEYWNLIDNHDSSFNDYKKSSDYTSIASRTDKVFHSDHDLSAYTNYRKYKTSLNYEIYKGFRNSDFYLDLTCLSPFFTEMEPKLLDLVRICLETIITPPEQQTRHSFFFHLHEMIESQFDHKKIRHAFRLNSDWLKVCPLTREYCLAALSSDLIQREIAMTFDCYRFSEYFE